MAASTSLLRAACRLQHGCAVSKSSQAAPGLIRAQGVLGKECGDGNDPGDVATDDHLPSCLHSFANAEAMRDTIKPWLKQGEPMELQRSHEVVAIESLKFMSSHF